MLATVHSYLKLKYVESGLSYHQIIARIDAQNPDCTMSDSKLSNILTKPNYKLSIEEMFALVDAFGQDRNEILAIIGEQEYRASERVGYKGAAQLIPEFERQITSLRQQYDAEKADIVSYYKDQLEKEAAMRKSIHTAFNEAKGAFDKAIDHLKNQLIGAEEKYGAAVKSEKWWRTVALSGYSVILLIVVYVLWEAINLDKGLTDVIIRMAENGMI